MKSLKRRLLSLFLAMVMVLSLAPGALAEDVSHDAQSHTTFNYVGVSGTPGQHTKTCATPNCTFRAETESCSPGKTFTNKGENGHAATCTLCNTELAPVVHTLTYSNNTGDTHDASCSAGGCGYSVTKQQHSYTGANNKCACGKVQSSNVQVTDISVSPNTATVQVGETTTLTPIVTPDNASNKGVTWASSNENVATVASTGLVTGVANGIATITATAADGSGKTGTCTVNVTAAATATVSGTARMKLAGTQNLALSTTATGTVAWHTDTSGIVTLSNQSQSGVTVTAAKEGSAEVWATIGTGDTQVTSNKFKITVDKPVKLAISNNNSGNGTTSNTLSRDSELKLTASTDVAANSGIQITDITWSVSKDYISLSGKTGNEIWVSAESTGTSTVTADVTLTGNYKTRVTQNISVNSNAISVSASVFVDSAGYALGDEDDKGKDSIIEQIDDKLGSRYCEYIWFDTTHHTNGDLDAYKENKHDNDRYRYDVDDAEDVIFTPDSSAKKGDVARFDITVVDDNNKEHAFEISFTLIEGSGSSGDVVYSAALGEDVFFDVSDFEDFYKDEYSSGHLEYVVFGSSSTNGTLYNEDDKTAGSSSYYVDPSSKQKSLDGIYFSPKSSMKRSTTVKISFTAYGTKRNNTGEGEVEGTVSIYYLNDNASDITYNTVNGKVTLDPKDFEAAYKEATSSKTAPSNLVIEFQNVPTNGTLTYTGGSRDKDLTKSTVKGTRYTTKSSGTNRLAQLTYSGTKGKDTIDYIAYSGGTAQFSGKVVFNGSAAVPQDVVVYYASTAGQPARFSQNDFTTANSAMSKAAKIRFVTPANGTLYLNGSTSAAGIDIAPALLYSVTYQPKAGFNGTDKVVFAAYDASNNLVANGSVNITVAGNPTTSTTPGGTTNPGGVTDVSQFTDVSGNAWYRANLATLVSKGVISGRGDGKFDPKGTVTYGEALKMVLESCGYTAAVGTGSQWAINYKNLAVSKGWISSSVDLNAAISRNATAELAAKVLGVAPVTSGSPFGDEANAYAVALYYTTPQIFVGTTNPNGGKPLFENNKPLLREQVCAVICRVSDYHTQHTTNVMPDGV